MHRAGTFPSKTDAQAVEKQHDDQMDHIHAALGMLSVSYTAKASHTDSTRAAALRKQTGTAYDSLDRLVMIWCGSTEVFMTPSDAHASLQTFERACDAALELGELSAPQRQQQSLDARNATEIRQPRE